MPELTSTEVAAGNSPVSLPAGKDPEFAIAEANVTPLSTGSSDSEVRVAAPGARTGGGDSEGGPTRAIW